MRHLNARQSRACAQLRPIALCYRAIADIKRAQYPNAAIVGTRWDGSDSAATARGCLLGMQKGARMNLKLLIPAAMTALVCAFASPAVSADAYPSKPITIVVPFAPGGATDVLPRLFAERLQAELGQPIVIENIGGAGGTIGLQRVARAAPDGYTIVCGNWTTFVSNGAIMRTSYDVVTDFEP